MSKFSPAQTNSKFGNRRVHEVSTELSERARRMVAANWGERRPYVDDLGLVRGALEAAGVLPTEPLLDFHRVFAGYTVDAYGDEGVLGLIHREVCVQSSVRPMEVAAYRGEDGAWVACADLHASYEMFLAEDGTFIANGPVASNYFVYTEQCAFAWDFASRRPVRAIMLSHYHADEEIRGVLVPRLASHRVAELSDAVSQVYATADALVIVRRNGFHEAWATTDGPHGSVHRPPELDGLKFLGR
jgi:hypothetical protein